jgi:hypothetical protein
MNRVDTSLPAALLSGTNPDTPMGSPIRAFR